MTRSAVERVLRAASSDVRDVLQRILEEPVRDLGELRSDVHTYLKKLEALNGEAEFLDLPLARQVAARCETLLARASASKSVGVQKLAQAAARYFVLKDDAEGDVSSPIGFDDDAEVVELIAHEIERIQAME